MTQKELFRIFIRINPMHFQIFAPLFQNQVLQLHDKRFAPFISSEEIDFALAEMAKQIEDDFQEDIPVFVGILNGAFMVVADLLKNTASPAK